MILFCRIIGIALCLAALAFLASFNLGYAVLCLIGGTCTALCIGPDDAP